MYLYSVFWSFQVFYRFFSQLNFFSMSFMLINFSFSFLFLIFETHFYLFLMMIFPSTPNLLFRQNFVPLYFQKILHPQYRPMQFIFPFHQSSFLKFHFSLFLQFFDFLSLQLIILSFNFLWNSYFSQYFIMTFIYFPFILLILFFHFHSSFHLLPNLLLQM